jgi:NAD(P)-dependent dehydrogenase (short-subunit alcohol dehydrogenase family)
VAGVEGKIVIVTGGTQGLGAGIARHLAERGAAGILLCGRGRDNGLRVAAELENAGCPATYEPADLASEEDCRRVVTACERRFSRIDGLVNAAGESSRGTLESTSVELWDRLFAVNVRAPFLLIQESVRRMRRQGSGGSIVNVITISSHGGQPYIMAYCASKGALATLTRNVAHALRQDHIRVNGINVGWMDTPAEHRVQRAMGQPASWLEEAEREQPFGRLIRPADVAPLVAHLLGDESSMMTGAIVDFDQRVVGAWD